MFLDRHDRRRPFAAWMRRLASLKALHVDSNDAAEGSRRSNMNMNSKSKKGNATKNNPYSLSSRPDPANNPHVSLSTPLSSQRSRQSSLSQNQHSISVSHDGQIQPKSRAPTLATNAETIMSDVAPSGVGTSATAARTEGGRDSTFSSPAPSVRSFATTLTTVQSIAPPHHNPAAQATSHTSNTSHPTSFHLQPATAVPAHLAPHGQPTTYQSATANNVLTDDASILTLASSSKRRRRNSVDTNASMKALAPASMFGGSRESLPLSVLSGTIISPGGDNVSLREPGTSTYPRSMLNAERASLISTSGITAPALTSERNSYIGSKYGDAASIRSGLLGAHGRTDSISGSIGGGKEPREKEKDKDRDGVMVTAPTSPLLDGPGTGSNYVTALGDVSEALDSEKKRMEE
ncbi:hypothetical protein LTR84_005272 [Exophiala bonariae]|uniref:Uncharacterized protein n=1 Tax=Exophiala bonariae TaxID=1690606 RepID=A0AAV9NTC2_9EURO|nr:hypothetical protein LTR84_005272 [Exophiala bonariae]